MRYLWRVWLLACFVLGTSPCFIAASQCSSTVNFTGWDKYGDNSTVWVPETPATAVVSGASSNFWYSFFVGPDTLMNVRIKGKIRVTTTFDDDYVGFVFGFKEPLTVGGANSVHNHDYWLFDWKQGYQNYLGWIAQEGMSLDRVDGTYTMSVASSFPGFWVHTNSPTFQVVQTNFGANTGWNDLQTYDFELLLTPTNVKIYIDNNLIFDEYDCFQPGRFGFYEMSQISIRYSDFTYELYTDFQFQENVCFGDTAFFTLADTACFAGNALTNIDTFYWDLGDGTITSDTNPWHVYSSIDTFMVSLIATDINGCVDTNTKPVYIREFPTASASFSNLCYLDSTQFTDQSSAAGAGDSVISWAWTFGDGTPLSNDTNPIHVYATPGSYTMDLAVSSAYGCVDSTSVLVEVVQPPVADFDVQSACDGDTVHLTNQTQVTQYPIASYSWDVENNQQPDYTTTNVAHVYGVFNQYAAKLEVVDAYGCVDSVVKIVNVHDIPDPNFSAPGVCLGDEMSFIDNSTVNNASIASWQWLFNGGLDSSNLQNPSYLYSTPEFHSVTLTVGSDSGCFNSITDNIYIYPLPVANFTVNNSCENELALFTDNSTSGFGVLDQWSWNFGTGTSTSPNPSFAFNQTGAVEVELAISNNLGCKDTIRKDVQVYPIPQAEFAWDADVCAGEALGLYDQSLIQQVTPGGDAVTSWQWSIQGVPQFSTQNPVYQTTSNSLIEVELEAISNYGCSGFKEKSIQVAPIPEAGFDVLEACEASPATFTNTSTISQGIIDFWQWTFNDGTSSNQQDPEHTFEESGTYSVKLKVRSHMGCYDSVYQNVEIFDRPQLAFQILDSLYCSPMFLQLKNYSTIDEGAISYRWLKDGSFLSSFESPTIIDNNDDIVPISRSITLFGKSDRGCESSITRNNAYSILPSPEASFVLATDTVDLLNEYVPITNTSKQGILWRWSFGDGGTSNEYEPLYTYPNSGSYIISLVAENLWGCTDEISKEVYAKPFIRMYAPNSFSPNGDGLNDVWLPKGFNENKEVLIRVFNRWGEELFSSRSLSQGWDGTDHRNGKMVPIGSYVYQIRYFDDIDDVRELTGEVMVLY